MKNFIKKMLGQRMVRWLRRVRGIPERFVRPYFDYDMQRLIKYSGCSDERTKGKDSANIIILYHIVEKGLTMPDRRFGFGKSVLMDLVAAVTSFEANYGLCDEQVKHAAGVVKAYWEMHALGAYARSEEDADFWRAVQRFVDSHVDVPVAEQPHLTRENFYSKRTAPFPEFAKARRTLRHYAAAPLPLQRLRDAVELALTTPSACNRQYCRVHCISNKATMEKVLAIQGGNRGFGHLADKLLVVTADLEGINTARERDDLFTNGGMFLMNLCYSLFYYEVAHCILNWSRTPEEDLAVRLLLSIKESETVIAVLSCGETPEEFDVASSPRKGLGDVFVEG